MGNTMKTNLVGNDDACHVSKYIKKVSGIKANSVSDTDIWILYFNPGTYYENEIVREAITKISINNASVSKIFKKDFLSVNVSLEYEINVYKKVIRPLLDNNISPNFIKYYATGIGCTFDNLLAIIEKDKSKHMTEQNLARNLSYLIGLRDGDRPSIATAVSEKVSKEHLELFRKIKYNVLVNELSSSPTFYDFLKNNKKVTYSVLYKIFFQAAVACYVMYLSKMIHHDIHTSNVFVEGVKKQNITYKMFGKYYTINTNQILKIYDFDKGYAKRLGPNTSLDGYFCNEYLFCNKLYNNHDIVKFFVTTANFYRKNNAMRTIISEIICKDNLSKSQKKEVEDIYNSSFLASQTSRRDSSVLNMFVSTEEMIKRIAVKLEDEIQITVNKPVKPTTVYKCEPEFFNEDGSINLIKLVLDDLS